CRGGGGGWSPEGGTDHPDEESLGAAASIGLGARGLFTSGDRDSPHDDESLEAGAQARPRSSAKPLARSGRRAALGRGAGLPKRPGRFLLPHAGGGGGAARARDRGPRNAPRDPGLREFQGAE